MEWYSMWYCKWCLNKLGCFCSHCQISVRYCCQMAQLVVDEIGFGRGWNSPSHTWTTTAIQRKTIISKLWKQSSLQISVQLDFLCMYWRIVISTLIQFLWLGSYVFEKSVSCLNSYNFLTFAVADWKSFLIIILLCKLR